MTKGELRSVGTANKKKGRKVTPLSSGRSMESVGIANRKKRESGTTCVTKEVDGKNGDVSWLGRGG